MGACNGKSDPPVSMEATNTQKAVEDNLDKSEIVGVEEQHSDNGDNQEVVGRSTFVPL